LGKYARQEVSAGLTDIQLGGSDYNIYYQAPSKMDPEALVLYNYQTRWVTIFDSTREITSFYIRWSDVESRLISGRWSEELP